MKLQQIGEDRLLRQIIARLPTDKNVIAGAGDDCAVVKSPRSDQLLLLKTDCVVAGVHFARTARPEEVGWKAMMRPLSDFAAMSGVPQFALITLIASPVMSAKWIGEFYRGLGRAARRFDVCIVGGETSATAGPTVISVSVAGYVEKNRRVLRSGGRSGDDLFVTGLLGGSLREKHLCFLPRIDEARWLTKNFPIRAMMDLSDGLGTDLPRLARASKLGFEIEEKSLPVTRGCTSDEAINDGEDYELLFALAPSAAKKLAARWRAKFPSVPLTRIGRLIGHSAPHSSGFRGYDHFTQH